jgi:sec-independent protein translocase protein TatB
MGSYHDCFMGIPPTIEFASLGMWDSLILMIMALVVFGPRRLPQIGRQIGKLMYEFRKASNDFKYQMEEELRISEEADRRKKDENRILADPAKLADNYKAALEAESQTLESAAHTETASPYPGEEYYPEIAATEAPIAAEESTAEIKAPTTPENAEAPSPAPVQQAVQHG